MRGAADLRGPFRILEDRRTGRRIFGDMDGAPADDRAAHGAGAQFCQSHSYRHTSFPFWPLTAVEA
jgi:hypothetical protein